MFGYVTPLKDELKVHEYNTFKSYYCGLCFELKKEFGNLPRMVLNYDMTFLGLLLDSLYRNPSKSQMKICLTNPFKKKPVILENEALNYAANMNVALVYYKLLDDAEDNKSFKSKMLALGLRSYKNKFSPSINTINDIIKENLNKLSLLEKNKTFSSIDEICDPFSTIVAEIFKNYPLASDDEPLRNNLFHFGYALGKWIYMIDALDDLKRDMEKEQFNPLNYLFNKKNLLYPDLVNQIKEKVSFTILNCGYNCKHYLDQLPLYKHKELLENIIVLGMMDRYEKVLHTCSCKHDS